MFMNYMIFYTVILLLMFMMLLNLLISKKKMKNREKMSSFECGFDPISKNRLPFSLQFFLMSIIFLIFDVEIALVLPMVVSLEFFFKYIVISINIFIMFILVLGLILEWKEGALEWFK